MGGVHAAHSSLSLLLPSSFPSFPPPPSPLLPSSSPPPPLLLSSSPPPLLLLSSSLPHPSLILPSSLPPPSLLLPSSSPILPPIPPHHQAEARSLDSRLDAEEAQAARERGEAGVALRLQLSKSAETMKAIGFSRRKQQVEGTVKARANLTAAKAELGVSKMMICEEQRQMAKSLRQKREKDEEVYLSRARANRERAVAFREAAKESVKQMLKQKQKHAAKERANDVLVTQAKVKIIESNRREVAQVYRQRFVGREAQEEWEASPLRRLQSRLRGGWSSISWATDRSARNAGMDVVL